MKFNRVKTGSAFLTILAIASIMPHPVLAQGATNGLGSTLNNVAYQTYFSIVASTLSYVLGICLAMWGVIRLKSWVDGQASIAEGLFRIFGGALMIAIPSLTSNIINSMFGSGSWSGTSGGYNRINGLTTNYGNSGGWLGLDQAMENFVIDIYAPGKLVTSWAAYFVGIGCMMNGVYRLAQAGQAASGRAPSTKGTVGYLVGGALLWSAGELMDAITTSLFGTADPGQFSSLTYAPAGLDTTAVNNAVAAAFAFVEVLGWIAFVRGIFLLVKIANSGPGERTHAHAFTHIVFGAAAVNMYKVVEVVQNSLGVSIVN